MGRGGCAAFFAFLRTCATACRTVANSFFNTSLLSCSMATAKIILLSTGSTKKKVKEDTGSRKNQIEKRNIERKAARGKKERGIRKEKVARSLTRKVKKDTRKSDTRKARTRATSGSEPGRRGRTAPRGTSTGKGSPRYAPRGRLRGRPRSGPRGGALSRRHPWRRWHLAPHGQNAAQACACRGRSVPWALSRGT